MVVRLCLLLNFVILFVPFAIEPTAVLFTIVMKISLHSSSHIVLMIVQIAMGDLIFIDIFIAGNVLHLSVLMHQGRRSCILRLFIVIFPIHTSTERPMVILLLMLHKVDNCIKSIAILLLL